MTILQRIRNHLRWSLFVIFLVFCIIMATKPMWAPDPLPRIIKKDFVGNTLTNTLTSATTVKSINIPKGPQGPTGWYCTVNGVGIKAAVYRSTGGDYDLKIVVNVDGLGRVTFVGKPVNLVSTPGTYSYDVEGDIFHGDSKVPMGHLLLKRVDSSYSQEFRGTWSSEKDLLDIVLIFP